MIILGKPIGNGWKVAYHFKEEEEHHGGYFYGPVNSQNQISGKNLIYLYPDFDTVLFGTFNEGKMVQAREAKIIAYKCQNGILDIKIKNKINSPLLKYDPPTVARISQNVIS